MRIYVSGGSGTLGRVLVPRLVDAGHRVTVASRDPRRMSGAETAVVDLATGKGLETVADHDVVVHLASDAFSFKSVDIEGTRLLLDAARAHGVGHFVGISIVGIDDHPYQYYRAKLAQEHLIEHAGIPWSLLRATQFHDLIPRFIRTLPPIGFVPVPMGVRLQPVDRADVARRLVDVVAAGPSGRVPDLGGPDVIPLRQMVSDSLRAMRLRRLIVPVPMFGKMGVAFRDGRMLTEPTDGLGWSEWVAGLPRMRDAVGRVSMLAAFLLLATAVFMLVSPATFHSEIAPFGAFNAHYIRDAATFVLPVVIGLWAAADHSMWRRPVYTVVALQNGAHLVNHVLDITEADPMWLSVANTVALALLEFAILWMWRETGRQSAAVREPAGEIAWT